MLLFAVLLSTAWSAYARQVKGTVVDAADEPLIGVSVTEDKSKAAVITDVDGKFTITVPDAAVTLKFSFIGFNEKTVSVPAGQNTVNVTLTESVSELNDVVVVGYGVQKKVNLTGAVA